jgi:DNA-binding MarR family transcriptional regulator
MSVNETKIQLLQCLSVGDWWTTPKVAQCCGLKLTNVSELLRRYRGQGLVTRKRNYEVPRGYLYRITSAGVERLQYFNSTVALTSSSMADAIGLSGEKKQIFENWVSKKLGGV